jgi:protein-S-isoprenylcysteine O-methyltransferase Ste14
MWNVAFYPIFTFELNANNNLTNITDKLNPIGKTIVGLFLIGILYFVFTNLSTDFDFLENWLAILIASVFLLIFITIFRKLYQSEKQNQLDEIFEFLDIEVEEKKLEKEWSLKNILIRLFTYPFCLFLIGLNIFLIIPNGQYILALGTFGFVGFYLFADLKMIFKK